MAGAAQRPARLRRLLAAVARSEARSEWPHASAAFVAASTHRAYLSRQVGAARRSARRVPLPPRPAGGVPVGLGCQDRTGAPVARSCPVAGGLDLRLDDASATFDRVVVTTAAPLPRSLPGALRPRAGAPQSRALHRRRLPVAAAAVTAVPVPPDVRRRPDVAVQHRSSRRRPSRRPPQRGVPPAYTPADDPLFDLPDDEVRDRFVDHLRTIHPRSRAGDVEACRISRVRQVFAVPTVGYRGRCRGRRRRSRAAADRVGQPALRQLQRERQPSACFRSCAARVHRRCHRRGGVTTIREGTWVEGRSRGRRPSQVVYSVAPSRWCNGMR